VFVTQILEQHDELEFGLAHGSILCVGSDASSISPLSSEGLSGVAARIGRAP
jgi:hypothetical protein